jgi:hypothetical protein
MQNDTAMRVQKMMSNQVAYAPVGMVSQDMSGNKKKIGGLLGINLNTTNVTPGLTFSNKNTTVTNTSAAGYTSSVGNAATNIGDTSVYWEFIMTNALDQWFGFAISTFNCNHANVITAIVGQAANTWAVHSSPSQFAMAGASQSAFGTYTTGDVIGLHLRMTTTTMNISVYKNGVFLGTRDHSAYLTLGNTVSYVPAWSSAALGSSVTISNAVHPAPTGAKRLTTAGTDALVIASASVPAVADGPYDVYTFNSSGTFTTVTTSAVATLVIAGGGSAQNPGGAGAGGYLEGALTVTPRTYAISVGAGAAAANTAQGSNSSFGTSIVATGGGSGWIAGSRNGGSGAGAVRDTTINISAGTGITGQGFAGGTVSYSGVSGQYASGGGGGAGGVGGSGTITVGGNGGAGRSSSITGTSIARGGGGAGHSADNISDYVGTATAGGGFGPSAATVNGAPNTGGGAGGFGGFNGAGGSGVVIIRVRARA